MVLLIARSAANCMATKFEVTRCAYYLLIYKLKPTQFVQFNQIKTILSLYVTSCCIHGQ